MALELTDRFINPAKATFVTSKRIKQEWRDMVIWLQDTARPGAFAQHFVVDAHDYRRKLAGFLIEDRNVAFEFKVRWG